MIERREMQMNNDARRRRIACIGEVMVEISKPDLIAGTAFLGVAGDTYNSAVHLARIFPQTHWEVSYVTLLGRDGLSSQMLQNMRNEGIETGLVGIHPDRLPGLYAIELDPQGERSFRYWRNQSAAKRLFLDGEPGLDSLDGFDGILLSLITLAILPAQSRSALITKLQRLKSDGVMIAFDSNYRPALWPDVETARDTALEMWRATSIALPSRDDEAKLWPGETSDALFDRLARCGVSEIALKDGASGPLIWQGARLQTGPFAPAEHVVDTSGAGDAFNAGYLAARLTGAEPAEAALQGHALAVRVIGFPGAVPPR